MCLCYNTLPLIGRTSQDTVNNQSIASWSALWAGPDNLCKMLPAGAVQSIGLRYYSIE